MNRTLRIGTRGSELALWQAHHVAKLLSQLDGAPPIQIVEIRTEGDHVLDRPLSEVPGKAFFTKEIEEALAAGHVDLAVHSLKDLPTELPDGLALGAVLEREDPRDVWLARGGTSGARFADLPAGGRVGTSSLRRRALVARYRPDLELVDLRGNVPTRVRRVEEGKYDAIVLAAAGVKRLGLERHITEYLSLDRFLPAVAQGAVAVEIRGHDEATRDWVRRLDHPPTHLTTAAERALLATLEGGCQVPVGALRDARRRGVEPHFRGHLVGRQTSGLQPAQRAGEPPAGARTGPRRRAHRRRRGGDPGRDPARGRGLAVNSPSSLAGLGVVVTRDEPVGGPLAQRLAAAGARVLHWPAVKIAPPADPLPLERAMATLESFDWLALTSVHAVAALAATAAAAAVATAADGTASRATLPPGLRCAVVGEATAAAVREQGWRVDRLPEEFSTEALVRAFAAAGDARARILFPASDRAADTLIDGLVALGAEVVRVEAYRTVSAALDAAPCLAAASRGEIDVVTFASPSAVDGLAEALGEAQLAQLLAHTAVAAIGATTSGALAHRGRPADAIADRATLDGLVGAALSAHIRFTERKLPCRC